MQPLYDFYLKVILMLGLIGLTGVLYILHRYRNRLENFKLAAVAVPEEAAPAAPGRRHFKGGGLPLVALEDEAERRAGQLTSLDLAGASLRCARPFEAGRRVTLKLMEPDGRVLPLAARVVWSNGYLAERKPVALGLKLGFIELSAEQRQRLLAIIDADSGADGQTRRG